MPAPEAISDWMWNPSWCRYVSDRLEQFTEAAVPSEEAAVWECPVCEASFVSQHLKHMQDERTIYMSSTHRSSTKPYIPQADYQCAVVVERNFPSGSR